MFIFLRFVHNIKYLSPLQLFLVVLKQSSKISECAVLLFLNRVKENILGEKQVGLANTKVTNLLPIAGEDDPHLFGQTPGFTHLGLDGESSVCFHLAHTP